MVLGEASQQIPAMPTRGFLEIVLPVLPHLAVVFYSGFWLNRVQWEHSPYHERF